MPSNSDYRSSVPHLAERLVRAGRVFPSEPGKLHSTDLFACSVVPFTIAGLPDEISRTSSLHLSGSKNFQPWRYGGGALQFRAQLGADSR